MKNTAIQLSTVALFALVSSTAGAATKVINQGRAGSAIVHTGDNRDTYRHDGRETRVALVIDKPEPKPMVKTLGRAGYGVIPASNRGR